MEGTRERVGRRGVTGTVVVYISRVCLGGATACSAWRLRRESLGSLLTARLFFFFVVVDGDLLQIPGLENLVTLHATQVIAPIPPHQKLRTLVLADRHT